MALRARGFLIYLNDPSKPLEFRGALSAEGTTVQASLALDRAYTTIPKIRLLSIPKPLVGRLTPHLSPSGDLCYLAEQSTVFDVFDPAGQVLQCINLAENLLGRLLRGEAIDDVAGEFFAYWGVKSPVFLSDLAEGGAGLVEELHFAKPDTGGVTVLSDSRERTLRKMKVAGFVFKAKRGTVRVVSTTANPAGRHGPWPPATAAALLAWQQSMDKRCSKQLRKKLLASVRARAQRTVVIVNSPKTSYGAIVDFYRPEPSKSGARRSPFRRVHVLKRAKVTPINLARIDDQYLAERSSPNGPTLLGKKIALLGCGTIGGFLAELLAKQGAGAGNGELALVDIQELMPENIGRHQLGFADVFRHKAVALRDRLQKSAPSANVTAICLDIRQIKLSGYDLVVDATGEEALGHWLARTLTSDFVPSISVWLEASGAVARAVRRTDPGHACVRCLLSDNWNSPVSDN